jgi:hypothetical protein
VLGDVGAVELSIQGTFLGPLETPAGIVQPTGAKIDVRCCARGRALTRFSSSSGLMYFRDGVGASAKVYSARDRLRGLPSVDFVGLRLTNSTLDPEIGGVEAAEEIIDCSGALSPGEQR